MSEPSGNIPVSRVEPVAAWPVCLLESPVPWVLLPLLAVAAVVWQAKIHDMVYPPENVTVYLQDGFGIQPGDKVRTRGIAVGEVVSVSLDHQEGGPGDRVRLGLRLEKGALHLRRADSIFWIERPAVGVGQLRGIDALAGGVYVAVEPGTARAAPFEIVFIGRDTPPAQEARSPDGLQVVLESPDRAGLEPGSPVRFRGFTVGHVMEVALAGDAGTVDSRLYIQPRYKKLIRDNTQFWSTSGVNASAKLFDFSSWKIGKLDLGADTLSTIVAGGVSFSTPSSPGREAGPNHRFKLASAQDTEKKRDEWLAWRPNIDTGGAPAPAGGPTPLPRPVRVTVAWQERGVLGGIFGRTGHHRDWLALMPEPGMLVGAAEMFDSPSPRAIDVRLRVGDEDHSHGELKVVRAGGVATCSLKGEAPVAWPGIQPALEPADALILLDKENAPDSVLLAERIKPAEDGWEVDAATPLPPDANGAPVVARKDGRLVGFLVITGNRGRIALPGKASNR
ncbi:MAG: MlaD family protein [Planctomycetota bacterium]